MKISNLAEDPATLDMEALGVLHAQRADPSIPLAMPWLVPGADPAAPGEGADGDGSRSPATYRTSVEARAAPTSSGCTTSCPVAVEAIPSTCRTRHSWPGGAMAARLGRALRGFIHPRAQRRMLWDVQHAPRTRALLGDIRDSARRDAVERVLDRFDAVVVPVWPTLRAQVVHSDLTVDNALVDEEGRITGIVDFGDMSWSAMVGRHRVA